MKTADVILHDLAAKGFRRSAAREAMVRVFASADSPLSVPDIEQRIASNGRTFNKTTVYREIEFLKTAGYVSELSLRNDIALYELSGPHHHHLVCVECGSVRDVAAEDRLWEREARCLERRSGFRIFSHSLEFFGQCGRCQNGDVVSASAPIRGMKE